MAQLKSALGLGPGEEDMGTDRHYSGYEAQGECLQVDNAGGNMNAGAR